MKEKNTKTEHKLIKKATKKKLSIFDKSEDNKSFEKIKKIMKTEIKKNKEENIEEEKIEKKATAENNTNTDVIVKNILIVSNLAYKENENSIKECFKTYGTIEKVQMSYSKEGKFIVKAIITFKQDVRINKKVVWNHKVLRIERMKNKIVNDKRIFLSHINKSLTILQIRNILKEFGVKPRDIRTRFETETKRNNGYCHITYNEAKEVKKFEEEWLKMKNKFCTEVYYEYAQEKINKSNSHRKNN